MARFTTPAKSQTTGKPAFAGIDFHKKFSQIAVCDEHCSLIVNERVPNDKHLLRQFFQQFPDVVCAVESCRGYEWFLDFLKEDLKLTVHLVNPYRTKLIAQTRCKTDKVDAKILMELLAIGFLPTCYQPTPAERRLREQLRWRAHLVRYATRMKVRIHALLDKENAGLPIASLFSRDGRRFLQQVQLSPGRHELLQEHILTLAYFEDQVAQQDAWVARTAAQSPAARLLVTIPGIGDLSALVIASELGDVTRFKNARQVASYAGLTPSVYSSADIKRVGSLTKQGSSFMRWILVQCAWHSIRHSAPLRLHFATVSRRCGRNAAVVSVARKLIQIAYRVLRDQRPFQAELVGKQLTA